MLIPTFTAVDSICFSPHIEQGINEGIITVIISKHSPHAWDELGGIYWKVLEAYPQFSFRFFDAQWVRRGLKEGNPFFAMHCSPGNIVYSTAGRYETCHMEKLKPKRFIERAKSSYRADDESALMTEANLKYYMRWQNHLQAAYTLHQGIRWRLIMASRFLTGEWLAGQDLEKQQRHLAGFSKKLGKAFDPGIKEEAALLSALNGACNAIQHNREAPELTAQLIEAAKAKKEQAGQEVQRLFDEAMARCTQRFPAKEAFNARSIQEA